MEIKKFQYSAYPWRLVNSSGGFVYTNKSFDHPDLGNTVVTTPVCGKTKQECLENTLIFLESVLKVVEAYRDKTS
jgi:hypothetical protein